jgi:hypothetical protein
MGEGVGVSVVNVRVKVIWICSKHRFGLLSSSWDFLIVVLLRVKLFKCLDTLGSHDTQYVAQ